MTPSPRFVEKSSTTGLNFKFKQLSGSRFTFTVSTAAPTAHQTTQTTNGKPETTSNIYENRVDLKLEGLPSFKQTSFLYIETRLYTTCTNAMNKNEQQEQENGDGDSFNTTTTTTTQKGPEMLNSSNNDNNNINTGTKDDDVATATFDPPPPPKNLPTTDLGRANSTITGGAQDAAMATASSSTATTAATTTATTKRLRLAEKRRTSTCAFANRVARLSIDHYNRHVDIAFRRTQQQTCVATLVAHEVETNALYVIAMGVGTKFLTEQTLRLEIELEQQQQQQQQQQPSSSVHANNNGRRGVVVYGSRVRDGHAEVLCRRAFRRYLTESVILHSKLQRTAWETKQDDRVDVTPDTIKVDKEQQLPFTILQPVVKMPNTHDGAATTTLRGGDVSNSCCSSSYYWQLRPGVTLHAYCSSAPCGNAVLKKFTSMKREVYCAELRDDTWPREIHAPMLGHAIRMGEFALLLKKDRRSSSGIGGNRLTSSSSSSAGITGVEQGQEQEGKLKSKAANTDGSHPTSTSSRDLPIFTAASSSASWPARQSTSWCPPGTTTVWAAADQNDEESGSLHTCSDKLCRWNCLGWQGSLLSSWIPLPIHVETITVGRKLSSICFRRAVCCRIEHQQQQQQQHYQPTNIDGHEMATSSSQSDGDAVVGTSSSGTRRKSRRKKVVYLTLPYKLNHPAILGTDVYMDVTGMIEMPSSLSTGKAEEGQDVRFHSSMCWAWWPGLETAEAINGTTGYAMRDDSHNSNQDNNVVNGRNSTSLSRVSTASLVNLFLQAHDLVESDGLKKATPPPVTLSELRAFKHRISPVYENAKELLLTKHPVFRQWKRRSSSNLF
jgi:Adenosine-deaminase (editase) domain